FDELLNEGERVCGEWLLTAVGTKYDLPHEPFVAFDMIHGKTRLPFHQFIARLAYSGFVIPQTLSMGEPLTIETALQLIEVSAHGALEPVEGAIWRVERKGVVDFLCKYVRADKVDGKYLDSDICNGVLPKYEYLIDYLQELDLPIQQSESKSSQSSPDV
ncbi:MAG TPA: RNA ligase family protein, partial [Ohtaekwangia sp.]|nr:RNA ligase family protein [Ohtaekwangia sp.]